MRVVKNCCNCEHKTGCSVFDSGCARYQTFTRYAIEQCRLAEWQPRRPWYWRIVRRVLGIGGFIT